MTVEVAAVPLGSAQEDAVLRLRAMSEKLLKLAATYEARRDPRGVGSFCLGRMQQVLAAHIDEEEVRFVDPTWIASLAEALHGRWISACEQYDANPASVAPPYRQLFRTLESKPFTIVEALVFALTAHIIHDLPLALIEVDFLQDKSRLADYETINGQLASEIDSLAEEIHDRYDGAIPVVEWLEKLGGSLDELLTDTGLRAARAWAWYAASRLSDPRQKRDTQITIEKWPVELMKTVRNPDFSEPVRQVYRLSRYVIARLPKRWPASGPASDQVSGPPPKPVALVPHAPSTNGRKPVENVTELPRFVDHWSYTATKFRANGVSAFAFLVQGDTPRLQQYCDDFFARPTHGTMVLEPVSPYVLIQFARTQHMFSPDNGFPDIGGQNEVSFFFFARRRGGSAADTFAVAPYIVVDNPISAMQARECFGLPKEVGRFAPDIPETSDANPEHLSSLVLGCPDPNQPDARYDFYPLVQVERAGSVEQRGKDVVDVVGRAIENPASGGSHVIAAVRDVLGEAELGGALLPGLVSRQLRALTLKEFKDVSSSRFACYQSIVATTIEMANPGGVRHLDGTYTLRFGKLGTHPIGDELGLSGELPAKLSLALSYDLKLSGRVLR